VKWEKKDGMRNEPEKISWQGTILSIQPRSTVWRYVLDNRTHSEIGFNLFLDGVAEDEIKKFCVAISEKQQQSGDFHIGDEVKGTVWTKMYKVTDYSAEVNRIIKRNKKGSGAVLIW
jgi:hypothetical protein